MHDIKQLEEVWERYHKNKRKPYYVYALIALILVGGGYYLLTKDLYDFKNIFSHKINNQVINEVPSKSIADSNNFLLNESIIILQEKKNTEIEDINISPETEKNLIKEEMIPTLPIIEEIPMIENNDKLRIKEEKQIIKKPRKRMHLNIIKSSSPSAYLEVAKRFNQFRDADDSLFLAKVYYEKGAYEKSEMWALKTNKINNNIEESWIIFAKSKVKLGKIEDAVHILTNYIRQSNSQAAKILLLKIKK